MTQERYLEEIWQELRAQADRAAESKGYSSEVTFTPAATSHAAGDVVGLGAGGLVLDPPGAGAVRGVSGEVDAGTADVARRRGEGDGLGDDRQGAVPAG